MTERPRGGKEIPDGPLEPVADPIQRGPHEMLIGERGQTIEDEGESNPGPDAREGADEEDLGNGQTGVEETSPEPEDADPTGKAKQGTRLIMQGAEPGGETAVVESDVCGGGNNAKRGEQAQGKGSQDAEHDTDADQDKEDNQETDHENKHKESHGREVIIWLGAGVVVHPKRERREKKDQHRGKPERRRQEAGVH